MFLDENGPSRKVERAKAHLDEFKRILAAHESSHPIRVRAEIDTKARLHRYRYEAIDPPPMLGLLAGEFVYQLRSALDHAVWLIGCSRSPSGEAPSNSEFPVFIEPRDRRENGRNIPGFEKSGRNKVSGLSPYAQTSIELMQPYHRGDAANSDPLWMLHELRNLDTHRVIQPVVAHLHIPNLGGRVRIGGGPFKSGDIFAIVPSTLDPKTNFEPHLAFSVGFPISGPAGQRPPGAVLTEIYEYVRVEVMPHLDSIFLLGK